MTIELSILSLNGFCRYAKVIMSYPFSHDIDCQVIFNSNMEVMIEPTSFYMNVQYACRGVKNWVE